MPQTVKNRTGCNCCAPPLTTCSALAAGPLYLTAPSGSHTLNYIGSGGVHGWACCFSFTAPYTRNNVFAGCPSVASGLAYIEYRIGNCPPYGTVTDTTAGLIFSITTGLNPCAASPDGFVYVRTAACSGNFLATPNYGFKFWSDQYTYPLASPQFGQIPIAYTAGPFSMSFTLPSTDVNSYPVPFPGSYVVTQ